MNIFIEPNAQLPLVSLSLAFQVGSGNDPEGKEGLARVVARMIRRGAAGRTATELQEAIDGLGAEMSGEVGITATTFGLEVISRNVEAFADLIADVLATPVFDEDELGKLVRETENELLEARDNDRGLAGRAFRRAVFAGHLYARSVTGSVASLRRLQVADVRAFYERHYNQAHAVIALSGDISEARGQALAQRLVAKLPVGERTPDPISEPSDVPDRRLIFIDKPERTQTQMYIGALGTHPMDEDHIPLHVATTILGGTFTARLMREVRSKRGWSYGAYARLGTDRHRETFTLWTAPGAKDAAECLKLELGLLAAWCKKGVTPKEVSFTKNYLVRSHVFDVDTAHKRVSQRLDTEILGLPEGYHELYVPRVKAVTKEKADEAIRRRIRPDTWVIAVVGTYSEIGAALEAAAGPDVAVTVQAFDAE